MIKSYTTMPVTVHDSDYPWYKPGYRPVHTCDYPYQFPYYHSYPTVRVTMDCKPGCGCKRCRVNKCGCGCGRARGRCARRMGFMIGISLNWLIMGYLVYHFFVKK